MRIQKHDQKAKVSQTMGKCSKYSLGSHTIKKTDSVGVPCFLFIYLFSYAVRHLGKKCNHPVSHLLQKKSAQYHSKCISCDSRRVSVNYAIECTKTAFNTQLIKGAVTLENLIFKSLKYKESVNLVHFKAQATA